MGYFERCFVEYLKLVHKASIRPNYPLCQGWDMDRVRIDIHQT